MKGRAPADAPDAGTLSGCIIAVACASDRNAFVTLFSHFAPRLKTFFLRGGMTNAQAEELAQEAMLVVWRKAALFDPAMASAATWVYAVARNLRIDTLRREPLQTAAGNSAGQPPPLEVLIVQDTVPGAEETVAAAQRARSLRNALHALPEEQSAILRLSYFGGKSQTEIAHVLGLPLGTVKSRVRLALMRLREALGEDPT